MNKAKKAFSILQLLIYLLVFARRGEQIIVYHSLGLMWPIKVARKIKKLSLVMEIEEIYTDVWKEKTKQINTEKEISYLKQADQYIFASEMLASLFPNKKSMIVYGAYQVLEQPIRTDNKKDIINVVYAGSIDSTKGGAIKAVECARFLPDGFRVNVIGYGQENEVEILKRSIEEVNQERGFPICSYHGIKIGEDYKSFLFGCDIGINPQKEGAYMRYAFPSKVLSYLSHHLFVVSTKVESVMKSTLSSSICFSDDDTPLSFAKAITIAANGENGTKATASLIQQLDLLALSNLDSLVGATDLKWTQAE